MKPISIQAGRFAVRLVPAAWLCAFVVVPLLIVLKISLSEATLSRPPYAPRFVWEEGLRQWLAAVADLGLDNFRAALSDGLYLRAAMASFSLSASATAILVVIGYPMALALSRTSGRMRTVLLAAVILPFWTSFLIRIYAWIAILKPDGALNRLMFALGFVEHPLIILNTNAAVLIGLVYAYLPFMILPIFAALDRLDPSLSEAAADLGAGPFTAFFTVTWPLSRPGLLAGILVTSIPIFGEFVIPDLLGGSDTLMIGRTLWTEFFSNRDWPLASAVAIVMLAILVVPVVILRELDAGRQETFR